MVIHVNYMFCAGSILQALNASGSNLDLSSLYGHDVRLCLQLAGNFPAGHFFVIKSFFLEKSLLVW